MNRQIINGDVWLSQIEINDYLNDENNLIAHVEDQADVFATIGEQMRGDDLVDDTFRDAVLFDDEIDHELASDIYSDLCVIVEAVEKGYILYDG